MEDITKIELKPCPFCGGRAEIQIEKFGLFRVVHGYDVQCTNPECEASPGTDMEDTAQEAADRWNKRV